MTASTGDFTIGYARARHDLGCRYTIGFYDRNPEEDRTHAVRVESAAPGLRVHHAASYSFPSRENRRRMAVQAAYMVPTMFEGGGMRAEVFPLEPRDRKAWEVLVAIDFPLPPTLQSPSETRREFGAVLTSGTVVSAKFARGVTLKSAANGQGTASRRLTFLEPATLSPGRYTLTAVLSNPGGEAAVTANVEVIVPDIPSRGPFLVGPMIGRRSGSDVVIHGKKDRSGAPADRFSGSAGFRPLIVTEIDRSQPLFAFTQACVSKKDAKRGPWRVARGLETAAGDAAGILEDAVFPGEDVRAMSCERYLDQVPVSHLRFGSYTFSAALRQHDPGSQSALDARAARFLLVPDQASGKP